MKLLSIFLWVWVDMSLAENRSTTGTGLYVEEDRVMKVYALADLVAITLAYSSITDILEEKQRSRKMVQEMINQWLEELAPIKHIPGLVEELSDTIRYKLWEVDQDIGEYSISRILVDTIVFKEKAFAGERPEVLDALSTVLAARLEHLLEKLGVKIREGTVIWNILYGENDPSERLLNLISAVAVTLVLATNNP